MEFLMLLHPLTNFELEKHCNDESRFHGIYSRQ